MTERIDSPQHVADGNQRDAKDLLRGVLYNFLGMVTKSSKVLFVLVAAKHYGAAALGLYFIAWSAIDIFSKLGLWGMDKSVIRDVARLHNKQSGNTNAKLLSIVYFNTRVALMFSVVVAAGVFVSSSWIAHSIFREPELATPMRLLAVAIPFIVLTQVLISTTKALRLMQYEVIVRQGIEPFVLLVGTVSLITYHLGATGLVLAHIFASFVATLAAAIIVFRKYRYLGWNPQPLDGSAKKEIFAYASPIAAMDFLNLLVARTDIFLIGAIMNSASAGLYGIAVEIISVIKRMRQGFEPIFAPIVSELFYNRERERLKRNYVLVTRWLIAGTLLPVIAMVLFPEQILAFFDVHSHPATMALIVLAIAHGLVGSFSAAENLLVMTGRTMLNALLGALMLTVNCIVGVLLIPKIGLVGAALGTLSAFTLVSIARLYHCYKQLHLLPFSVALFWPIITAFITATLFYALQAWIDIRSIFDTIAVLIFMALTYGIIYLVGASEPEEKHLLTSIKLKIRNSTIVSWL